MLVLTRKSRQAIRIGDDINIVILSVGKDSVKIGIEAPQNTDIWREEIARLERKSKLRKK